MAEINRCNECGIQMSPNAPQGLCPKCLLKAGLDNAELANLNIRCPHCQNAVEVIHDAPLSDINCPSCGSSFSLVHDPTVNYEQPRAQVIGHFELVETLGTGAFGTVWKARDTQLDRTVAVKIPRKGQLSAQESETFLREARAAAQLNHPNIVSVHEVGRKNGHLYIVSDFVEGTSLADWLTTGNSTPREAAQLCLKIARALKHAHQAGIVHRDMKPHNIMLDEHHEPHIMDFGLAKRAAGEITMTVEGKVLGTPAYMSPEQAKGEAHQADARSDIYSLGVILFELLTGERPFRGNTRMLIHQVIHEEAPLPRKLNGQIPLDLDTICRKCLEKDARLRYQSASELAAELERYLNGEAILARPIGPVAQGWRWCKRNPVIAGLSAAVVFLLLALGIGGPIAAVQQAHLAEKESIARNDAEEKGLQLEQQLHVETSIRLAGQSESIQDDMPVQSLLLAIEAVESTRQYDQSIIPFAHQTLLNTTARIGGRPMVGHAGGIRHVAISPNGRWLVSAGRDKVVRLWDLTSKDPASASHELHGHKFNTIWCAAFSPNSQLLVTGSSKTARLWDLSDQVPPASSLVLPGHEGFVTSAAFSPDGRWLATGSTERGEWIDENSYRRHPSATRLWDLKSEDPASFPIELREHDRRISKVAFSPDGHWLATGSWDDTARLWDLTADKPAYSSRVLHGHEIFPYVRSVAISPDGRWLVAGNDDTTATLWDLNAEDPADSSLVLTGHERKINSAAFSADSRSLVTADDKAVRKWDLALEQPASSLVLPGHESAIIAVAISPDSRWLVTGGSDNTPRLWDLKDEQQDSSSLDLPGHEGSISAVAISSDGRWLVTGSADTTARLWDLKAEEPASSSMVLQGHKSSISAAAFSPDGRWLVTGSTDATARLWDLKGEDPAASSILLAAHSRRICSAAFSPDSLWLVTGSAGRSARVWDLSAEDPAASSQPLVDRGSFVCAVAFSPDGHGLITGSTDGIDSTKQESRRLRPGARRRDLTAEDRAIRDLLAPSRRSRLVEYIRTVTFSPDGRWLVTGSDDMTAGLWDVRAEDPIASSHVLRGHEGNVYSTAFSSDSRWLVTGSSDHTARLWDLSAGDPTRSLHVFRGHEDSVNDIAISPDGRWLATASADKTARLWDLSAADPPSSSMVLRGHESYVSSLAITPNGRWLVTGSGDATARLWDLNASDPSSELSLRGHGSSVAFSPDARWVITADEAARLWDLNRENPTDTPREFVGHTRRITSFAVSPDGRWLATGSDDKTARLWDLEAEDRDSSTIVLTGFKNSVGRVAFSSDGRWLAIGCSDKTTRLWDLTAEDPTASPLLLKGKESSYSIVIFSQDCRWLATGGGTRNHVRLWDLAAEDPAASSQRLDEHEGSVRSAAFLPDSQWLVTGSHDKTARMWKFDGTTWESQYILEGHEQWLSQIAPSEEGDLLVTGSADATARIWNMSADDPSASSVVLKGHQNACDSATISRDGRWVATGSRDKTARLWDLGATEPVHSSRVLRGHDYAVFGVTLSSDNRWLVTQGQPGRARLWDLDIDRLIRRARRLAGRELTAEERTKYSVLKP